MKKLTILIIFGIFLSIATIVKAEDLLPTVSTACEFKNGQLFAMNDGFSLFKKCDQNSRRVVLLGEKGNQGLQGLKGDTGAKGEKGDQGLSGEKPEASDIVIFSMSSLIHNQYSEVFSTTDSEVITLSCLFENGGGGIWVYYSDNQTDWNLDYMAGCSGNSNTGFKQITSTVKGQYYKFKVVSSFLGKITAILY